MNSKYAPLESHLRDLGQVQVPMTFKEIEHVIGAPLPPSAFKHRALWSNNPANWVMTKVWLAAGYKTEKVEMENGKLVFRKAVADAQPPETGGGPQIPRGGSSTADRSGSFARVFGALKDTVTISPGTNLTDPIDEDWDATR